MVGAEFSQLLAPGSLTRMLKNASEAGSAFVLIGLANGTPIAALGILMAHYQDWPQVVADLAIGAGTICAVRSYASGGVRFFHKIGGPTRAEKIDLARVRLRAHQRLMSSWFARHEGESIVPNNL